jgi:uncharacterized RDD family membrane protein YckC
MYCTYCGYKVTNKEAKYCSICGDVSTNFSEYLHATKAKRFLNSLIDTIFIYILSAIIFTIYVFITNRTKIDNNELNQTVFYMFFVYYFFFEVFYQKTPAKYITKTVIVDKNGKNLSMKQIFIRTLSRFIPIDHISFLQYALPVGVHDALSKTNVVEMASLNGNTLKGIEVIERIKISMGKLMKNPYIFLTTLIKPNRSFYLVEKICKIISVLLLIGALAPQSPSYFIFLRWAVFISMGIVTYFVYTRKDEKWMWFFIAIACVYNPLIPIYLQNRDLWLILDVLSITSILMSFSSGEKVNKEKE